MRPAEYRYKRYANAAHSNNFYNGPLLAMGFMNSVNVPTAAQIFQAQKERVQTYSKTLRNNKLLAGLNANIFNQSIGGFSGADLQLTNRITEAVANFRKQYSPIAKNLRAEDNQINVQRLVKESQDVYDLYTKLLQEILQAIGPDGGVGIASSSLIQQLTKINEKIEGLLVAIQNYSKGEVTGAQVADYFYSITTLYQMAAGFVQEDEAVSVLSEWLPHGVELINIGSVYTTTIEMLPGGQGKTKSSQSGVDLMAFDSNIMDKIKIKWMTSDSNTKSKIQHSGTLRDFIDQVGKNKQHTFYLSESTHAKLCRLSIATLQSKAMGIGTKRMIMKRDVQLFTPESYLGLPSFNLAPAFRKYMTQELQAIIWMKRLYELSAKENKGKSNYKERHADYQALINYSLSKMVPYILANNQFLLSNRYGLISFEEYFNKEHGRLSWGTNKTALLADNKKSSGLASAKYHIYLTG